MMKKSAWFLMLFFMFTGCNNLTEKDFACNTLKKRGIEFSEQTFMKAVKSNESSTVNLFLDAGMNVDALDKTGRPALMNSKDTKIVELLLKAKANVNKKSKKGYTALHFAAMDGNIEMISLLMKYGAEIDMQSSSGETPLMYAVTMGKKDVVLELLKYNPSLTIRDYTTGINAIDCAFQLNFDEIGNILLDRYKNQLKEELKANGVKYTKQEFIKYVKANDIHTVKLFLNSGMNPDSKDEKGRTALMYANDIKIAEMLIIAKVNLNIPDLNIKDSSDKTALDYAIENKHTKIIDLLRKHGAKTASELKAKKD